MNKLKKTDVRAIVYTLVAAGHKTLAEEFALSHGYRIKEPRPTERIKKNSKVQQSNAAEANSPSEGNFMMSQGKVLVSVWVRNIGGAWYAVLQQGNRTLGWRIRKSEPFRERSAAIKEAHKWTKIYNLNFE